MDIVCDGVDEFDSILDANKRGDVVDHELGSAAVENIQGRGDFNVECCSFIG